MANDLEVFQRLPESVLRPWLQREKDAAVKTLINVADPDKLRQAQGRAQLLQQMLDLLDKVRSSS